MKKNIRELIDRNKRDDRSASVPLLTRCFICALPVEKRQTVEKSLMESDTSLEAIAKTLRIAKASVWRHAKNHLVPRVKQQLLAAVVTAHPGALEATKTVEDFQDLNARAEIVPLYQKARALLLAAEGAKDYPAVKGFLSESRQILELCARLDGKLNNPIPQTEIVVMINAPAGAEVQSVTTQLTAQLDLPVSDYKVLQAEAEESGFTEPE